MRSLQDLTSSYLDEDHEWDQLIKPKLLKQIEDWKDSNDWSARAAQMNAQNMYNITPNHKITTKQQITPSFQPMPLQNEQSQSTYYDPNRPTTEDLVLKNKIKI